MAETDPMTISERRKFIHKIRFLIWISIALNLIERTMIVSLKKTMLSSQIEIWGRFTINHSFDVDRTLIRIAEYKGLTQTASLCYI